MTLCLVWYRSFFPIKGLQFIQLEFYEVQIMYFLNIIVLVLLLLIASLFSFLETASVAVSEHRLISLASELRWAKYALRLKRKLEQVLIFSLFGNSFFNAAVTTFSTMLVIQVFGGQELILSLFTLFVTLLIIIFSEAVPKIIASKVPLVVLRLVAIPLYYIFVVTRPLIWLIDKIVYGIIRLLGVGNADGTSLDELKAIVADKRSPFADAHRSILLNSLELNRLTIKEVVIPIRNVEMIDLDDDITSLRQQLQNIHHTRIPVYRTKIDNILGYLHIKDILTLSVGEYSKEDLTSLVREISYVSDFMFIIEQLKLLQLGRERIFIVVNEYGDILGVACFEDLLEMVFGDFTTNAPHRSNLIIRESEFNYIVDGAVLVREFNEAYNLNLPFSYDAMSINGLILKHLGSVPALGVCMRLDQVVIEVIQVGRYWAERVRVSVVHDIS